MVTTKSERLWFFFVIDFLKTWQLWIFLLSIGFDFDSFDFETNKKEIFAFFRLQILGIRAIFLLNNKFNDRFF